VRYCRVTLNKELEEVLGGSVRALEKLKKYDKY
jgi:hypothetical protein